MRLRPGRTLLVVAFSISCGAATTCSTQLEGVVTDPSGAVVEGATLSLQGDSMTVRTDEIGHYRIRCVPLSVRAVTVSAPGFERVARPVKISPGGTVMLNVQLAIETAKATVDAASSEEPGPNRNVPVVVLSAAQLDGLADDPVDFRSQLQSLASATAGLPGTAAIYVDGFTTDNGMPPKSSIREVRINPDLFSAEYQNPPFQGGAIEIVTKAAGKGIHGSLGISYGASPLNSRDSLAPTAAATGKKGASASLAFPLVPNRFDLIFDYEKRLTDEFQVVKAITGLTQLTNANIAAPEDYQNGDLRSHVQLNPLNSMIWSYSVTHDLQRNQGVGGLVLPQAGYSAVSQNQSVRATWTSVLSTKILFENRASYSWGAVRDVPISAAPTLFVSGAFIGGGSMRQNTGVARRSLDTEHSLSAVFGKHSLRAGMEVSRHRDIYTAAQGQNGMFTFAGGSFGDQLLSGLQQYSLAIIGQPGGTPTAYSVSFGNPNISIVQWRVAGYVQDQWRIAPRVTVTFGLRQAVQTAPRANGLWAPRFGFAWAADKKNTLVLRLRYGQFLQPVDDTILRDTLRLNGSNGYQLLVYNPDFLNPLALGTGSASFQDIRALTPNLSQVRISQAQGSVEKQFKGQWKLQTQLYWTSSQKMLRSESLPEQQASVQEFLYAQNGRVSGPTLFVGFSQVAKRRFTLVSGYIYSKVKSNADTPDLFAQSSQKQQGEFVQPSYLSTHRFFTFGQFSFPMKINATAFLNAASGLPFNVTTGTDLNGDGVFNERPGVVSAPATDAFATPFGYLTESGRGAMLSRNIGRLPYTESLDLSVNRKFSLKHAGSTLDSVPTVLLSVKAKNALNHTNISAVDSILNSPLFLHGIAADASRRIEAGLRFEF